MEVYFSIFGKQCLEIRRVRFFGDIRYPKMTLICSGASFARVRLRCERLPLFVLLFLSDSSVDVCRFVSLTTEKQSSETSRSAVGQGAGHRASERDEQNESRNAYLRDRAHEMAKIIPRWKTAGRMFAN